MKKVKKFLSVLCAACMAITLLPSAMAADLPSEPNVYRLFSAQEFNSIAPRSTATGRVMLPRSNSSGNVCYFGGCVAMDLLVVPTCK